MRFTLEDTTRQIQVQEKNDFSNYFQQFYFFHELEKIRNVTKNYFIYEKKHFSYKSFREFSFIDTLVDDS